MVEGNHPPMRKTVNIVRSKLKMHGRNTDDRGFLDPKQNVNLRSVVSLAHHLVL